MSVTQDYKVVGLEIFNALGKDHYAVLLDCLLTRKEYLNKMIMGDSKWPDWHDEKRRLCALMNKLGHGDLQ